MDADLAKDLSKILDCYGLDEESRKKRMDCQRMTQLLMSWNEDSLWSDGFGDILLSGSSYETTTIDGLSSDIDIMIITKNVRVIENIEHWRPDTCVYTYMMDNSGYYKGFVKLHLMSQSYPGPVYSDTVQILPVGHTIDTDQKILLKNDSKHFLRADESWEQHGPALTEKRLKLECDNVVCLKCDSFPTVSLKWKERQTMMTRSRINAAVFDQATHCYLVGVGNKGSPTENVEWRLSFSHIENSLVHDWNNVQYKSYVMMKFVKKDLIEPSAPGIICSYHFKTILMWMNEEYDKEFFAESNFDKCLLACLQNLLTSTKKRSLPHYFIEGCNLFYGKINNELKQISTVLERLLSTWPQCLFHIQCRNFGMMLQSCFSRHIPPHVVCEQMDCGRVADGFFGVVEERVHIYFCYLFLCVSSNTDAMQIFNSLLDLKKRTNLVAWDNNIECKQFIEFFTKDALCRFGLSLISQSGNMSNKQAFYHKRSGYGCIHRYINDCHSTTCLEVAGHFTTIGDVKTALNLLEKAEKEMKYLTSAQLPNFNSITITEHCKRYYDAYISYNKDNITRVPGGFVLELFQNTALSPPLQLVSKQDFNCYFYKCFGNVSIPSTLLLYYLQFLCFNVLGSYSQRKVALDNIKWISLKCDTKQVCGDVSYNIIGHCYRTCGEDQKAYWNYRKSLKEKRYHNAVIWHLAVLLRARVRGQR